MAVKKFILEFATTVEAFRPLLRENKINKKNEAVKTRCAKSFTRPTANCKVGICGEAPSDYRGSAAFLVRSGSDSISINPDRFIETREIVTKAKAKVRQTILSASNGAEPAEGRQDCLPHPHICIEKMTPGEHDYRLVSIHRDVPLRGLDPYGEVNITRRRLPHWHQSGVAYFITFRLADSLPQPLLRQWQNERARFGCDGILNRGSRPSSVNSKSVLSAVSKNGWMLAWAPAICDDLTCGHRSSLACCTSMARAAILIPLF